MDKTSSPRHPPPASIARLDADDPRGRRHASLRVEPGATAAATGGAAQTATCSAGGALLFELTAASQGVHVVRTHRRTDGSKVHCSVLFDDLEGFTDWLDADPMRFTHPLVFQQARRCFHQLQKQGSADEPAGR